MDQDPGFIEVPETSSIRYIPAVFISAIFISGMLIPGMC